MPIEKIKKTSEQILNRLEAVKGRGEEATKQALVIPMLDALGYDIWNPAEVCPEFEADFAMKKTGQKEKVDLAVLIANTPRIYIEVKALEAVLDGHEGQLARYFNATTSVTLGVLTNGIEWRFFTDTGDPNIMDSQPFHVVRLDAAEQGLEVLAFFAKQVFSPEAIRDYATELKYTAKIAAFLRGEIDLREREPSEYFLRWVLKSNQMYEGVVNNNVLERFRPMVKTGLTRVIREIVRRSITAMDSEAAASDTPSTEPKAPTSDAQLSGCAESPGVTDGTPDAPGARSDERAAKIVTTENELRSFAVVKEMFEKSSLAGGTLWDASSRRDVPLSIAYKDTSGYFCVYFNKPFYWILRVVTESKKPWVGFDLDPAIAAPLVPPGFEVLSDHPFATFRVAISSPEDLFQLSRLVMFAFEKVITDRTAGKATTPAS